VTAMTGWERSARPRAEETLPRPRPAPPAGRIIVSLRGGLDLAAAPVLREQLIDVLHRSAGTDLLILDLSHVPACDPAGLAVLIGTQRRARLLGSVVLLAAPGAAVTEVLRSSGLHRHFTIYPDVLAALGHASSSPAGDGEAGFPRLAVG
jgi:anti-anti-sigma factor